MMIALRCAILMKADPVVSLHGHRLFSGRACSCKKDPCYLMLALTDNVLSLSSPDALLKTAVCSAPIESFIEENSLISSDSRT